MKKESFRAFLALSAGCVMSLVSIAVMFYIFHWPGGRLYLMVSTCLVACLSCIAIPYVCKFGILKPIIEKGFFGAKHLRNIEIAALVLMIIIPIGVFLKLMHLPGAGPLLLNALLAFSILSLIAAFVAYGLFSDKYRNSRQKIHVLIKNKNDKPV